MSHWLRFQWWKLTHPRRNRQRRDVIDYAHTSGRFEADPNVREIVEFLETAPIDIFPYAFRNRYFADPGSTEFDGDRGLHYIHQNGRRLYWQPERKAKRIPQDHAGLRSEQDERSPHRYLTEGFDVGEDDIIADIGCGEANFTLEVIDRVRHAYLFESDPRWNVALNATFSQWKDKVTIVPSMVGRETNEDMISLDDFFSDKEPPTFLKLDVEGHEADVLRGAEGIIRASTGLRAVVCTYHRQDDLETLTALLEDMSMDVRPSRGHMLLHRSEDFAPPYFRKGLVRATLVRPDHANPTHAHGGG
jgi:hypothetical protein